MMKMFIFRILFVQIVLHASFCDDAAVLQYTDNDFSTKMVEHKIALVMFYAPWCGHCKNLTPKFAKAAKELVNNDPPIALAKVDCTDGGKETCETFKVSGYPTLKIFGNGKFFKDYAGPRDVSGMITYMIKQAGPSSREIIDLENLESFTLPENIISLIGFFKEESELKTAFLATADDMREAATFAHTSLGDILDEFDVNDDIILFRPIHMRNKFEDHTLRYSGNSTSKDIKEFITKNRHGLVGHRKSINGDEFKSPLIIAYYQIDYKKNAKGTNYWRNRILKVAIDYKGILNFAVSPIEDVKEFGDVSHEDKPIIFAKDVDDKHYKMQTNFSVEALQEFVEGFLAKKLEPYIKSEPIPEDNDGPLLIAVAKNFNDIVVNNGKDTLITFHSPRCGHCKRLMPIYEELAEVLEDEDVAIVKMDGTKNDLPSQFTLDGYPSIYWLPKDSKDKPVKYDGGRKMEDLINYISEHATEELIGFDRKGESKSNTKTEL